MVATLVKATGKAIVSQKQREAIRRVVIAADPAVQQAAALVADELDKDGEIAMYVRVSIGSKRSLLQTAYNQERTTPESSFDTRLTRLEEIRMLYNAEASTPSTFEAISKGAAKVGEAHAALVVAANSGAFTSASLKAAIAELQASSRSIAAFVDSIKEAK